MESLDALAGEFLDFQRRRVSPQGYEALTALTRYLVRWLEEEALEPAELGIAEAVRYAAELGEEVSMHGERYAVGTIHNRLKIARKFFGYLVQTERRRTNPFLEVEYPRMGCHLSRNVLTEAQMGRLLRSLERFDELPTIQGRRRRYRVHVLAEFLYATGLRIAEACSLCEENLDLEHRRVWVRSGKGERPRMAFLNEHACEVMEAYLHFGRAAVMSDANDTHRLFGSTKGRMLLMANKELRDVCRALGLPVITTHGFRHSLGTHLLRSGADMRHIQVILGHEALSTTQVYTRVDKEDLKKSLDAFHPRRWNHRGESD